MRAAPLRCALLGGPLAWAALVAAAPASADGLRDPTRPPQATQGAARPHEAAPVLSAIFVSAGLRSAIFNGQFVRSGGSVGSYAIEAVLEDGVRYRHAGRVQELHLPQTLSSIKKPATDVARISSGVHP
jgi:hypothetical protein